MGKDRSIETTALDSNWDLLNLPLALGPAGGPELAFLSENWLGHSRPLVG